MICKPCSVCILKKHCPRFDSIKWTFECCWNGLKSLKAEIKCDWFDRLYSPGARVSVHLHEYHNGYDEDYEHYSAGDFKGTISRITAKRRVAVWLDSNQCTANEIVTVPFGRITFINELPINVCKCGLPEGNKNKETWFCDECDKLTTAQNGGKP